MAIVDELKEHLSHSLPDYMIPGLWVILEKIPLTTNGKVDRKALPEPEIKPAAQYVAPQSDNEREITEIWKKVLGLEKIGVNDNFFDIGGNSLKIIQISVELKNLLGTDIAIAKMFQYPTIASLARYIAKADHNEMSQVKDKKREEAVELESIKSRLKQRRERNRS
jgi:acyl carrier protein